MVRWALHLVSVLLLGVVVAGCTEEPAPPANFQAVGRDGRYAPGWAYDGATAQPFDGSIAIDVSEASNSGSITASGPFFGHEMKVRFFNFYESPNRTFQHGGVAANLLEHGDSGNGDASIPRVEADLAAWGEGTITLDGEPFPDPSTGNATWLAHVMVLKTGVRDETTNAIYKKDRSTPYNPGDGSDGHADPADQEIHMIVRPHEPPNATEPINITSPQLANPAINFNYPLPKNSFYGSRAQFVTSVTGTPGLQATQLNFTIKDPKGTTLQAFNVGGSAATNQSVVSDLAFDQLGVYRVEIRGQAVGSKFQISGALVPPPAGVYNFWWEDVQMGIEVADVEDEPVSEPPE